MDKGAKGFGGCKGLEVSAPSSSLSHPSDAWLKAAGHVAFCKTLSTNHMQLSPGVYPHLELSSIDEQDTAGSKLSKRPFGDFHGGPLAK
jgi:hypothetical protein